MQKKILIGQNIEREGPGLLLKVISERGLPYEVIDFNDLKEIPSLDNVAALVVLGGPDSANDTNQKMQTELELIKRSRELNLPFLGICLGLQTLVKVSGGEVVQGPLREVGLKDPDNQFFTIELTEDGKKDSLFQGLGDSFKVFHLHGETVKLASGMTLLGRGKFVENQVVRVGENAWGLQCHFELTPEMLKVWREQDTDILALPNPDQVLKDFAAIEAEYTKTGLILFNNFIDQI